MESHRKILDILEAFLASEGELSLSDIADRTKLHVSTIHGIVTYLRKRGYIVQNRKREKYSLGYKFLDFSDVIMRTLPVAELALRHMKELNKLTHETVILAIAFENAVTVVGGVESNQDLRVPFDRGRTMPYSTSLGKVLMANKSNENWDNIPSVSLKSSNPNVMDISKLKEQFVDVKREGYAIDNQESALGILSIGAPVRNRKGEVVAAVGIFGPTVRMTDVKIEEFITAVKNCAFKISRSLGYKDRTSLTLPRN